MVICVKVIISLFVCNVSFIVCVALCTVFCLSVVCHFVRYVYFSVLRLIVVPQPPGENRFAVQFNNNNNNNNNKLVLNALEKGIC
jgi:hypothetical protein